MMPLLKIKYMSSIIRKISFKHLKKIRKSIDYNLCNENKNLLCNLIINNIINIKSLNNIKLMQ